MKLIVCDFDGTLVPKENPNLDLDDETVKLLTQLQNRGIEIAIATGRHPTYLEKRMKKMKFSTVVGYSGNLLQDGRVQEMYCFSKDEIRMLLQEIKLIPNAEMVMYSHKGIACASNRQAQKNLQNRVADTSKINDINGVDELLIEEYLSSRYEKRFCRICLRFESRDVRDIQQTKFSAKFNDYRFVQTGPRQMEVLPKYRSKASEIMKILEKRKLGLDEVVTIGDDDNDYEMLKDFPYSCYVGNENPRLGEVAAASMKSCKEVLQIILQKTGESNV